MQIKLWKQFSKRKNSTKRPNDSDAITIDVVLKEATSVEAPHFILKSQDFEYNYCQAFGHYYFISNITSVSNEHIMLECTQDLLATAKETIQTTSAFIERSSSDYDTMLPDPYVSVMESEVVTENIVSVATLFNETGIYVISVLNNIGSGAGFTTYYILDTFGIKFLAQYCNRNLADSPSITEIVAWLQATYCKTADAVIDCKWLPLSVAVLAGLIDSGLLVSEPVKIGKDIVQVGTDTLTGLRFTATAIKSAEYSINTNYVYDDFRIGAPFTKGFLYIPFYGVYQFNTLDFTDSVTLHFDIDMATGDTTLYLRNQDAKLIATLNYNLAVNAPVGKVGNEAGSALTSVAGGIGSAITAVAASSPVVAAGAAITAAVSAGNLISSAAAISPSVKGTLAGRSMAANGLDIHMITISSDTINPADLRVLHGRPLMTVRSLSGLTGYVKTIGASVNYAGLGNDKDIINGMLDSGIYIE